ncbi:hypothetical protein KKF91_04785 [Myxococcota bacterium]|nr:hypothetical protein [Myxococcota bacterium]MBU1429864.1 hypothetical protein [Myxococcota bacterium]MBU1896458.1 hypothetical protein [Myxococcota bacterium]
MALEYALSHDLRAPLRTLLGFSVIMREDYDAVLDDEGRQLLTRMEKAAAQMRVMLDALLYLSHKTRAPLNPGWVDLGQLACAQAQRLGLDAPTCMGALRAWGDEALLSEVLWALLENAARFAPGAEVILEGRGGGRFELRDTGPGCAASFIERAFEPFAREHGGVAGAGVGLGLTLARRALHRHHGLIWIEPREVGFCVGFELPEGDARERGLKTALA